MNDINYNPFEKDVFVLYQCPNCGRNDCSCVPPVMKTKIPFFINCDCGGWVIYQQAWLIEPPMKAVDVLLAWVSGDDKIINELKPSGKFKEVTDKLDPDGMMLEPMSFAMNNPELLIQAEQKIKDFDSKKSMYV